MNNVTKEKKLINSNSAVFHGDARDIDLYIPNESIDVTITSPPYFDMKDYGSSKQIGFGQSYIEYLKDLRVVFKKVFDATKPSGTLWVIIDTFKRNGEVVPLPFDFSNEIRKDGWKLKDIIIWKKDKTVPWSPKGATRKIFEYVLCFSKTDSYQYNTDRVRSHENIKDWWIKYPERYHPKGKALEEIWEFGIPTQGSWGGAYIRHFCPLPSDLVERIISLSTNPGDVVLDPFSGTGTVPAQAYVNGRNYFGIEINKRYIEMFYKHLSGLEKKPPSRESEAFSNNIIKLRTLKYARTLIKKINAEQKIIKSIYVTQKDYFGAERNIVGNGVYRILVKKGDCKETEEAIKRESNKPPLSKFGIKPNFIISSSEKLFLKEVADEVHFYRKENTNFSYKTATPKEAIDSKCEIFSDILVKIENK